MPTKKGALQFCKDIAFGLNLGITLIANFQRPCERLNQLSPLPVVDTVRRRRHKFPKITSYYRTTSVSQRTEPSPDYETMAIALM